MKIFDIISQEQRMKITEELFKTVQPTATFYLMTVMSSLVVTYGLLINSIALVFIGVVVSPLFSTIFAFALSLIKADIHLMRKSIHSAATGILVSFAVAILFTLLVPGAGVTPALMERMRPNIFDLIISVAVGVGAGYLLTREGVGPYLPGLAMAILLVPHVSVAGIGLTLRRYDVLGGASLLLVTNLIALIAGNSIIFWVRGFIPYWSSEANEEIKKKLFVTMMVLLILAAPLTYVMFSVINQTSVSNKISNVLMQQLGAIKKAQVISYDFSELKTGYTIDVMLRSPERIDSRMARGIKNMLEEKLNKKVSLNISVVEFKQISAK